MSRKDITVFEQNDIRDRMQYLQELRPLGYVPCVLDFYEYGPLRGVEAEWHNVSHSTLAHKLRAVGVPKDQLHEILFDEFCDQYMIKHKLALVSKRNVKKL